MSGLRGPFAKRALPAAVFWLCLLTATGCLAQDDVLAQIDQLERAGRFKEAHALCSKALGRPADAPQKEQLLFEQDRLERIRKDFPLTKEQLFKKLESAVEGLSREEFERWVGEGRFDSRVIDGVRYYMVSSVGNLFFRYPDLSPRRKPKVNNAEVSRRTLEVCREIKAAATTRRQPYVLPLRFRVQMNVTAAPGAAPSGQTVRAWLPIPRRYPFQDGFNLISSSSALKAIAEEESPIRSVCLEQTAAANKGTAFEIAYDYTRSGIFFDIKPSEVRSVDGSDPALRPFLQEGPHIEFTPQMRELSRAIAGAEVNPYLKAKKFYDWIAANIKYSYAIEYSTIRNIGEYCRSRGYGDCGQEALLFMTLCRMNGIPARWESGWSTFPGAKNIHDWAQVYLEPYGWVPVDPYMGIYAMQYAQSLTPEERLEVRDFYFGGMDQYRMAANSDHCQDLKPARRALRSDTVDFQRGELECGDRNIYFDQFSYSLEMKVIKQERQKPLE